MSVLNANLDHVAQRGDKKEMLMDLYQKLGE